MESGIEFFYSMSGEELEQFEQEYHEWAGEVESEYDDSMDGDWDSGMASAGFGTDEDYGYYGDE